MTPRRASSYCWVLLLLGIGDAGLAFNPPGHFESVRLIVEESLAGPPLSPAEKTLVAACAQLPDMSEELDATKTYVSAMHDAPLDWASWGVSDHLKTGRLQQMFAVQQLQHALTGGDSMAMRMVALQTLRTLATQASAARATGTKPAQALCALGLGLHLWGDAFAHTQVTWTQDLTATGQRNMYPTGRGHGLLEGHLPDDILCSYYTKEGANGAINCHQGWDQVPHRRFVLWEAYWSKAEPLLGAAPGLPLAIDTTPPAGIYTTERIAALESDIKALGPAYHFESASPDAIDPKVGEKIHEFLNPTAQQGAADGLQSFRKKIDDVNALDWTADEPPCSDILNIILNLPGVAALSSGQPPPTCLDIWRAYYPVVIDSFERQIAASQVAPHGAGQSSPIDPAWRKVFQPSPADSASIPISCYAGLVAFPSNATVSSCGFKN